MVPPRREVDLRKGLRPLHESWWWRWNAKDCLGRMPAQGRLPVPSLNMGMRSDSRAPKSSRACRPHWQTAEAGDADGAMWLHGSNQPAPCWEKCARKTSEGGRTRHQRTCYRPIRGVHVRPTCASPLTEEAPHALR